MSKMFNISGACRPDKHYMVQLGTRLAEIKKMIDEGDYFAINRARQYIVELKIWLGNAENGKPLSLY